MIRIYIDTDFEVGKPLQISKDELHYLTRVRRGQGEVEVFNQRGELARGTLEKNRFIVQSVSTNSSPAYDITLALAVPDRDALSSALKGISELGLKKLILFPGERSQAPKNTEKSIDKLNRMALESMRQCGRSFQMKVEWLANFTDLKNFSADEVLFLDELDSLNGVDHSVSSKISASITSALIVIGPEGGWSSKERDFASASNWKNLHLPTPILKVSTACIAAGFFVISRMAKMS